MRDTREKQSTFTDPLKRVEHNACLCCEAPGPYKGTWQSRPNGDGPVISQVHYKVFMQNTTRNTSKLRTEVSTSSKMKISLTPSKRHIPLHLD